jgi:hypothetical protein
LGGGQRLTLGGDVAGFVGHLCYVAHDHALAHRVLERAMQDDVGLLRGAVGVDGLMHLPHMLRGEFVEPLGADVRSDVQPDRGLVVAARRRPHARAVDVGQPAVEPLGDGGVAGDGDTAILDVAAQLLQLVDGDVAVT